MSLMPPAGLYPDPGDCLTPPAWDPEPGKPYRWAASTAAAPAERAEMRNRFRDWWCCPRHPLPPPALVAQLGPEAVSNPKSSRPDSPQGHRRWERIWLGLQDAANRFWKSRGVKEPAWDLPAVMPLYELLPLVRYDACVRWERGYDTPADLSRALARLRCLCAMLDPEADRAEAFWISKIKSPAAFRKHLPSMLKQITEGDWPDIERKWAGVEA